MFFSSKLLTQEKRNFEMGLVDFGFSVDLCGASLVVAGGGTRRTGALNQHFA